MQQCKGDPVKNVQYKENPEEISEQNNEINEEINSELKGINASLRYAASLTLPEATNKKLEQKDQTTSNKTMNLIEKRQKARDEGKYEEEEQLTKEINNPKKQTRPMPRLRN